MLACLHDQGTHVLLFFLLKVTYTHTHVEIVLLISHTIWAAVQTVY